MQTVILLHGLARTSRSMKRLEKHLQAANYEVFNIDYPSRHYSIQTLAEAHVLPAIKQHLKIENQTVHFVTHSMGGIIVRYIDSLHTELNIDKVVMLAPPNHGSELVDKLGHWHLFKWINGPAGQQLGTGNLSVPRMLGEPKFKTGIIAGHTHFMNLLSPLLPSKNDGNVTIDSTRLKSMQDFIALPTSHNWMLENRTVMQQSLYFLQNGHFLAA